MNREINSPPDTSELHQVWLEVNPNAHVHPDENCVRALAPALRYKASCWLSACSCSTILFLSLTCHTYSSGHCFIPLNVPVCVSVRSRRLTVRSFPVLGVLHLRAVWSVRVSESSAAITASSEPLQLFRRDSSACLLVEFVTGDFLCGLMSL